MFIGDVAPTNIWAYGHQFHIIDECIVGLMWWPVRGHVARTFVG
jgi:hypothetical protein